MFHLLMDLLMLSYIARLTSELILILSRKIDHGQDNWSFCQLAFAQRSGRTKVMNGDEPLSWRGSAIDGSWRMKQKFYERPISNRVSNQLQSSDWINLLIEGWDNISQFRYWAKKDLLSWIYLLRRRKKLLCINLSQGSRRIPVMKPVAA